MDAGLTLAAFLFLTAVAAYVIHRLNAQRAERIAVHAYGQPLPGGRADGQGDDGSAHRPPVNS